VSEPIGCPTPGACSCLAAENEGLITIPRAQYDGLMAAAKALLECHAQAIDRDHLQGSTPSEKEGIQRGYEALAVLRSAAICPECGLNRDSPFPCEHTGA
jgi:hypothetical protein